MEGREEGSNHQMYGKVRRVATACSGGLTGSCPIHDLKSDSEVKHVVTSVCYQSDVDHITLSDGVVLWIKLHLNSCKQAQKILQHLIPAIHTELIATHIQHLRPHSHRRAVACVSIT